MERWLPLSGDNTEKCLMNAFRIFVFGSLVLTCVQSAVARTHVILLDDSKSMLPRYANNLREWLITPLLKSSAFATDDHVIVRWFNQRGSVEFDPKDPQRKYDGKFDAIAITASVPTTADVKGDTDIPEALELALTDLDGLKITGEVYIWLITDNVQDVRGASDIGPFYEKIKNSNEFQAAYIFPLTNENGAKLPESAEAMVMYLFQYSKKPPRAGLEKTADDVGRKIGNVPVSWFPIDKGVELNESGIIVNDEVSGLVDGKLKLPDIREGAPPEFTLQFPFESKLKNLRIVQSRIIPQKTSSLTLPQTVEVRGDSNSWRGSITPTELTLEAGKRSAVNYTTTLQGDMTFHPASFWNAVWNSTSEPIEATFDYRLMDVEAQVDVSGLNQVRNLRGIENNVRQSQKNIRSRSIPMSFQVQYNSLWRRLLLGVLGAGLVGTILGASSLLLIKKPYLLATPSGEEILRLPAIGQNYIRIGGDRAAVIKSVLGSLKVAPLGSYTVNGQTQSHKLSDVINPFGIEDQTEQRQYQYVLSRITRASRQESVKADDFLD